MPKVDYRLPNHIVTDPLDVRQELASAKTQYHDIYGSLYLPTGGKAHEYTLLPLTPEKNPIAALRNQPMRAGYQLFMDVETVGNYYGENYDEKGDPEDSDMQYKMQVTPRYWNLNLDTGTYTPVDLYMGVRGEYRPVAFFDGANSDTEYLYYLNWLEESKRRSFTAKEKEITETVRKEYGKINAGIEIRIRGPENVPDPLGSANRLFLNDKNRTFFGTSETYGINRNPDKKWKESEYGRQAQRWHFTIGTPSSTVFIEAGKSCTDQEIKKIKDQNSVIVCEMDIKVRGEVWTLEYKGDRLNHQGGGLKIFEDGNVYPLPVDPETGKEITAPIVGVYENDRTAKDDLRTEGSH